VGRAFAVYRRLVVQTLGRVKSKTEKLPPVASLVLINLLSIHHLRDRAGLVGPVSV